jgi:3-keto-disaccharide hydrolase
MRTILVLSLMLPLAGQTPGVPIKPKERILLFNEKNLDGWYTWLQENKYEDPKHVFTVRDGAIRISGEEWGGLTTRNAYRDYHLVVEWKWGGPNHGKREHNTRDSGILVHGVGEDGAYGGTWLQSIESQVIEGGTGDFIMVGGKERPTMTAKVREFRGQFYWDESGVEKTLERGRFNWFARDPDWKDQLGFRGPKDLDKPVGEWNRQEVIADGDKLTNIVNGVVANKGYRVYPTAGKIQLQSEGAEIYFRRVEMLPVEPAQADSR